MDEVLRAEHASKNKASPRRDPDTSAIGTSSPKEVTAVKVPRPPDHPPGFEAWMEAGRVRGFAEAYQRRVAEEFTVIPLPKAKSASSSQIGRL